MGLLLGELAAAPGGPRRQPSTNGRGRRPSSTTTAGGARRDRAELVSRSSERIAGRLLPVLDSLDSALLLDVEAGASSDAGIREGLSGTRDLLLSILAAEGLAPIEAVGSVFDPALHEAVQIGEGEGAMVVAAELAPRLYAGRPSDPGRLGSGRLSTLRSARGGRSIRGGRGRPGVGRVGMTGTGGRG